MGDEIVKRILHSYGLTAVQLLPVQKGYRNESHPAILQDNRTVNVIIYKREPGIVPKIQQANRVANYLANAGFPARRTLDDRIVQLQGANARYASLYDYLPGQTIPWEAYTMEHLKQLGKVLSDLHDALAAMSKGALTDVADEYLAILDRMRLYFDDKNVQRAMQQKLGLSLRTGILPYLTHIILAAKSRDDQQILHMDFVRGNILFTNKTITGILDFEKTGYGTPLFDIARTLAFLLVDCKYKDENKVRKYFLHSGYQKRGKADFTDRNLLEQLTLLLLTYDFYKFLKHNPYEFLNQNEHYLRTKAILLRKHILQMIN